MLTLMPLGSFDVSLTLIVGGLSVDRGFAAPALARTFGFTASAVNFAGDWCAV